MGMPDLMNMKVSEALDWFRGSQLGSVSMTTKDKGDLIAFVCPEYAAQAMDAIGDVAASSQTTKGGE